MRILVVEPGPAFSVADVCRGWKKALKKQGHEVMTYTTSERLTFYGHIAMDDPTQPKCESCGQHPYKNPLDATGIAQMALKGLYEASYLFWPDVIIFVSAFFTQAAMFQVLRQRGHKIVMLHTESPYQDEEQMLRGQFADLNIINDPTRIEDWKQLDVPVEYIPHSYDPDIHFPAVPRSYEADFSFIGTMFKGRQKFFHEMLETGIFNDVDAVFGGSGWELMEPEYSALMRYLGHTPGECVDNEETARIYRLSKVGINFYRREGESDGAYQGHAMGPREIEMAASGLFFLRDPRPESDEVFGGILPSFRSPQEAAEQLRWWVDHDDLREHRAREARAAIESWTFDNRAAQLMKLLEEEGLA